MEKAAISVLVGVLSGLCIITIKEIMQYRKAKNNLLNNSSNSGSDFLPHLTNTTKMGALHQPLKSMSEFGIFGLFAPPGYFPNDDQPNLLSPTTEDP